MLTESKRIELVLEMKRLGRKLSPAQRAAVIEVLKEKRAQVKADERRVILTDS
jgi:hypothetical protein